MTSSIYDIIALVAGITSSVVLATVLFTVAWIHRDGKTRYAMLLRMYGIATLLDSSLMLCLLYAAVYKIDYRFIQYFIQPTLVSIETGLGAFAIFRLFRGSSHYLRLVLYSSYAFWGVVLLYPVMYGLKLDSSQEFWNIGNYLDYARSAEGIIISIALYVMAFIFNFLTSKNIFQGYMRYREILREYFSFDLIHMRHICMAWWGLCLIYVFLAYVNIIVEAPPVHHVLRYVMIIVFLSMVLIMISHADMLKRIDAAFRSIKIHNVELLPTESALGVATVGIEDTSHTSPEITQDAIAVREILEHWAKRSDKPFNEKCITLKTVSEDMHLPMSVVLKYVHICYGMGFRSWILALREESEKE